MTILDTYKQRMRESRNYSEPHWNRAIDNYKHYLGRLDAGNVNPKDYPFYSKMTVPVSYEVVETVMPRIIGKDPEFTAVANEPSDVPYEQTAKLAIQMGYNNPKLELLGEPIYLKLQRGVKEELITGNVVWRAYWRRQTTKRVKYLASLSRIGITDDEAIQKVLQQAKSLGAESEVTYSKKLVEAPFLDDFDIKHVPFYFFFPDVPMIDAGRMRYKVERDYYTFEELADEAGIFGYDDATMQEIKQSVDEKRSGFTPEVSKDFLWEYQSLFGQAKNGQDTAFATDDDKIQMLIVDKMWEGDKVHVIVNEKWLLTGEKGMVNPYDVMTDPFIFGQDVVLPHSYFAYGEIDAIRKLEDGMTDLLNMRFDNLLQSMLNYWLVNPRYIAENDEFVPIPNSITSVKDVDKAVRQVRGNDVTPTAYKEADELYAIIQRVTGANDYAKGMEGDTLAGRTYGGLRLVQEAANARFIVKSRLFEKMTLKSLGYFCLEMSKQFINKDRIQRQFGDAGEAEQKDLKAGNLKSILGYMDITVVPNSSQQIDQQADAMKLNAVADRFSAGKGAFANIPEEVYDKFLQKYLLAYGVTDAVYWVRAIKDARQKANEAAKNTPPQPSAPSAPQLPPAAPPALTMPTMQGDGQIANQPLPMEALAQAGQAQQAIGATLPNAGQGM